MKSPLSKCDFECLYNKYNRRKFVHPDPLEFLYDYDDLRDREIVALIASSLAYGRVAQILKSVEAVLKILPNPRESLISSSKTKLQRDLAGFKHRFTASNELVAFLSGIKEVIKSHGSLYDCFMEGYTRQDSVIAGLSHFVDEISSASKDGLTSLLPKPRLGSACKRLNLFLRWMVRNDEVDPGGWGKIPAKKLVVPLDTHMHNISGLLGITKKKQANMATAQEITDFFKTISPQDPVKYDFALTRFGIRNDMSIGQLCSWR